MKDKLHVVVSLNTKLPITRSQDTFNEQIAPNVNNSKESATSRSKPKVASAKVELNIPIGDVNVDGSYEKSVTASYVLPSNYVKHHRRLGDETDPSIEYVANKADDAWLKNLGSTAGITRDLQRLLSLDALEAVINLLERFTGLSNEPIPLMNAQTLVTEKLSSNWSCWADPTAVAVLLPEVYRYWLLKRQQNNRPLCRKYWPHTNSADTDPHQVFRTRDKERYRLRKQQKRNDVESYRKMQQLRRDFSKAQMLMQFIQERERLNEAEFVMQREIFEQRVHDLGDQSLTEDGVSISKRETPFRYTLTIPDLLYPPKPEKEEDYSGNAVGANGTKSKLHGKAGRLKNSGENGRKKKHGSKVINGALETHDSGVLVKIHSKNVDNGLVSKDGTKENPHGIINGRIKSRGVGEVDGVSRKKRRKDKLHALYVMENGVLVKINPNTGADGTTGAAAATAVSSSSSGDATTGTNGERLGGDGARFTAAGDDEPDLLDDDDAAAAAAVVTNGRVMHPDLDGPSWLCQPAWPSFMDSVPTRNPPAMQTSWLSYLTDLESSSDLLQEIDDDALLSTKDRFYADVSKAAPTNHSINNHPISVIEVDEQGNKISELYNNSAVPSLDAVTLRTTKSSGGGSKHNRNNHAASNSSNNSSSSSSSSSSTSAAADNSAYSNGNRINNNNNNNNSYSKTSTHNVAMNNSKSSVYYKADVPALKYRARCRLGRGNRLVIDRIPIIEPQTQEVDTSDYTDGKNQRLAQRQQQQQQQQHQHAITYVQPTSLSSRFPYNSFVQHYGKPPPLPTAGRGRGAHTPANPSALRAVNVARLGALAVNGSGGGTAAGIAAMQNSAMMGATAEGSDNAATADTVTGMQNGLHPPPPPAAAMQIHSQGQQLQLGVLGDGTETASVTSAGTASSFYNKQMGYHRERHQQEQQGFQSQPPPVPQLPEVPLSNIRLLMHSDSRRSHKGGAQTSSNVSNSSSSSSNSGSGGADTEEERYVCDVARDVLCRNAQRIDSMPKIPALMPPSRPVLPPERLKRLKEIEEMEDSEDERMEITNYARGADAGRAARGRPALAHPGYVVKHRINL